MKPSMGFAVVVLTAASALAAPKPKQTLAFTVNVPSMSCVGVFLSPMGNRPTEVIEVRCDDPQGQLSSVAYNFARSQHAYISVPAAGKVLAIMLRHSSGTLNVEAKLDNDTILTRDILVP